MVSLGLCSRTPADRVLQVVLSKLLHRGKTRPLLWGPQVSLKGQNHELILVRGPDDARWRLVDVGYGGNPPIHPLLLEHPSDDSFSGAYTLFPHWFPPRKHFQDKIAYMSDMTAQHTEK